MGTGGVGTPKVAFHGHPDRLCSGRVSSPRGAAEGDHAPGESDGDEQRQRDGEPTRAKVIDLDDQLVLHV